MTSTTSYWDLPGLADVYFEDSWVLGITAEPGSLRFEVEVVLRESHPNYQGPKPGEQYDYRRGHVVFRDVTDLKWTAQGAAPALDAAKDLDFGSFDQFERVEDEFVVSGDFGRISVRSATPVIEWAPHVPQ